LDDEEDWLAVTAGGLPVRVARLLRRVETDGVQLVERHLLSRGVVLELGCGLGRWFPQLHGDRDLIGMDFARSLLHRARANHPAVPVVCADARRLPVASGTLDAAYTVKVLQCLPQHERPGAVRALFGAVTPGGLVILYEKIRGQDGSSPKSWTTWADQAGGELVAWYANEFLLLDRLVVLILTQVWRVLRRLRQPISDHAEGSGSGGTEFVARHGPLATAYGSIREASFRLALVMEPVISRLVPRRIAQHGVFVFRRV
jgi:SAM-dependent methyltransferase